MKGSRERAEGWRREGLHLSWAGGLLEEGLTREREKLGIAAGNHRQLLQRLWPRLVSHGGVIDLHHSALCIWCIPQPHSVCTAPWTSPTITHSAEGPPASPWSAWRMGWASSSQAVHPLGSTLSKAGEGGVVCLWLVLPMCHAWVLKQQRRELLMLQLLGLRREDNGMLSCFCTPEQPRCPPAAAGPLHPLQYQGSLQEHPHTAAGHGAAAVP